MYNEIVKYFSKLYFPAIASKCLPVLLYSGILQKFVQYEVVDAQRYRLNVMLLWDYGWFKSSILNQIARWMPFDCNILTSSSSSAIRGSFVDNSFYEPELLISDLMIFPELTAIIEADKETQGQLLGALEEANVRVALVKAGRIAQREIDRIHQLGATFVNKRLEYRNKAICWTATHTIDNLNERLRKALLSRFFIVNIANAEIPPSCSYNNPTDLVDLEFEERVAEWFYNRYTEADVPDQVFGNNVLKHIQEKTGNVKKRPREVGDIRRIALAHHALFPDDDAKLTAEKIQKFFEGNTGMTTREMIAQFILDSPKTIYEIIEYTGQSESNVYNHINRLKAMKVGVRPTRYYLNDIPVKKKRGRPKVEDEA